MIPDYRTNCWLTTVVLSAATLVPAAGAIAGQGRFLVPVVSGRPEMRVFSGHPGWVDVFRKGYGKSESARIGDDGRFELAEPDKPVCLIAMFDRIETPPVILPRWPTEPGKYDVTIPVEYACMPAGDRASWDEKYMVRATDFWQTFVPTGTQLYGVSVFDGPKIVEWGNKLNIAVHEGSPKGKPLIVMERDERAETFSAGHSDHELPRTGWRHGDMEVVPGRTYALRASGYRSHGNRHFKLDAYIRPDKDDGYARGEALADGRPTGGDLCCLIFGNSNGQLVENHIRSEEWEIFIPRHRPALNWGQTFVAHGVSLAGISFWGSNGSDEGVLCEVRIRVDGPWGKLLKPVKVARGLESPDRPIIRYPDIPGELPGHEAYYKLPCKLFQVAYMPGEVKLTSGKSYYVELLPGKPLMMYVDGNFYQAGYAYYEGLKADLSFQGATFHSHRWTLAMNIVTYANQEGTALQTGK